MKLATQKIIYEKFLQMVSYKETMVRIKLSYLIDFMKPKDLYSIGESPKKLIEHESKTTFVLVNHIGRVSLGFVFGRYAYLVFAT